MRMLEHARAWGTQTPRKEDLTRRACFSRLQRPGKEQRGSTRSTGLFWCTSSGASVLGSCSRGRAGRFTTCFFWQHTIPWEDLKDLSGTGLLVHHHLPCESVTVSWEGKTGTPHWKLHIRQQLHRSSQIPFINVHHMLLTCSVILPPAFCAGNNLNRSLRQNYTPDNTLYKDNTR